MFTQPCFIRKNTPELRKKLEELGYKSFGSIKYEWDTGWGLSTDNHLGEFESFDNNGLENIIKCESTDYENSIDCGTNEELFLALAALRDDTNANQWLTDGKIWGKFDEDSFLHPIQIINYLQSKGHKASIEEIIEHFKDK